MKDQKLIMISVKEKQTKTKNKIIFLVCLIFLLSFFQQDIFAEKTKEFKKRDIKLYHEVFEQSLYKEIVKQFDIGRWMRRIFNKKIKAANVNRFDEVPDSSFFINRHAKKRLSPESLERGYRETEGPDFSKGLTIINGKCSGMHPGFFVKDSKEDSYLIKFDPLEHLELATAAEIIASRFYYAIGYNVPQYTIAIIDPEKMNIGEGAEAVDDTGFEKPLTAEMLEDFMAFVPKTEEGYCRVSASKILQGKNKGAFSFRSKRKRDKKDIFYHRDRREIRGLHIFATWLNNYDVREGNTLDMSIKEDGKPQLKHYLIDFNSALGAAYGGVKPPMFGYENMFDYAEAGKAFFSLGLREKPWQRKWDKDKDEVDLSPAIGYFDSDFDPAKYKVQLPFEAFKVLTRADGFWAAKIMLSFSDDDIKNMVKSGEYSSVEDAEYIAKILIERRDKTAYYWLNLSSPLDEFDISAGMLSFKDLLLENGFKKKENAYYNVKISETNNKNKEIAILKMEDTEFSINPSWIKDHEAIEISIQASYEENEKSERPSVKIILSQNGIEGISHED